METLDIEYRLGGVWRKAGCGVFKPLDEYTALFSRYFPLPDLPALPVEAVRLSAWGLGGTGVTFVKIRCGGRTFVPVGVAAVSGRVRDSAALLREDTNCCWFGGQSTREDYFDRDAAQVRHRVELVMAEKSRTP